MQSFSVHLDNGKIVIPKTIQETLNINEGDNLTLLKFDNLIFITTKKPEVSQLTEEIVTLRENEGISLDDLLTGIEEERLESWQKYK
jgi:AbrB family looped-hinge helix DNA binding protein